MFQVFNAVSVRRSRRFVGVLFIAIALAAAVACYSPPTEDSGTPTAPSATPTASGITFTGRAPSAGRTVIAGQLILPGSGLLEAGMSITASRELPWAQLNVYLLTEDGRYCGQNLPHSPIWQPFPFGQPVNITVEGWQIFRLPCNVTGIRAMLHNRISGALFPPRPDETIAEATLPISFEIR